jgi:CheY-like chemotaxis protein
VASCDDPTDAFDTFAEDPDAWDVVVTDQTMPGLTGMELARRLLQRRPDLPIVLCTGFSETANEETARAAGIAAFLNKPVDPDKLASAVRRVLDEQADAPAADPGRLAPAPLDA